MELKFIFKILKQKLRTLAVLSLLGGAVGGIIYASNPIMYKATGSFYISRKTETINKQIFSYEGYYAQQTAQTQTSTIATILESSEIRTKALEKLGIKTDGKTLGSYKKRIDVKKTSPQIVTLTVHDRDISSVTTLWTSLSDSLIEIYAELNENGDKSIYITKLSAIPVVTGTLQYLFINVIGGVLISFTATIFVLFTKEYLND